MDFNDTKEEAEFRLKVKAWLKENAPKSGKSGGRYDPLDVQDEAIKEARELLNDTLRYQSLLSNIVQKDSIAENPE